MPRSKKESALTGSSRRTSKEVNRTPDPDKAQEIMHAKGNESRRAIHQAYPKALPQPCKLKNNEFDYADLYEARSNYTAEQKISAVTAYVMTGTTTGASRLTGLKQQLICEWKNKANWWPDAYKAVKIAKQEEMDGAMTALIHVAAEEVMDRLLNGDEVISKDGDPVRKKMSGKDSAWVLAIMSDKRALLRGDPTSRTEKVDTNALLEKLADKFEQMAQKEDPTIVSEQ